MPRGFPLPPALAPPRLAFAPRNGQTAGVAARLLQSPPPPQAPPALDSNASVAQGGNETLTRQERPRRASGRGAARWTRLGVCVRVRARCERARTSRRRRRLLARLLLAVRGAVGARRVGGGGRERRVAHADGAAQGHGAGAAGNAPARQDCFAVEETCASIYKTSESRRVRERKRAWATPFAAPTCSSSTRCAPRAAESRRGPSGEAGLAARAAGARARAPYPPPAAGCSSPRPALPLTRRTIPPATCDTRHRAAAGPRRGAIRRARRSRSAPGRRRTRYSETGCACAARLPLLAPSSPLQLLECATVCASADGHVAWHPSFSARFSALPALICVRPSPSPSLSLARVAFPARLRPTRSSSRPSVSRY